GRANYIMDNLIAASKAKPMILVMPYGYSTAGVGTGPVAPTTPAGPATGGGRDGRPGGLFADDFLTDLVPHIEKTYRTVPTANNRAIGGLSMGGGQTVAIGFAHPELFSYIIVMSAGA